MFVEDNATGALLLLTVGHMLGAIEAAGDRVVLKLSPGTPVLQPGPADGGGDADIIAKVERAVLNERCDAGVAALIGERRYSALLPDGGRIRGIALPRLGMRVRAFGRSGWLESTITLIEAATNVGYLAGVQQRFTGLFMTEKLSTGGDAGAVVLEADTNRAVGLIFAGSEQASVCIPIATVLRELDVRIPGMDQSIEVLEEQMLAELTAVNDTVGIRQPDRLGYETYIDSFVRLIRDPATKPPLTIGIYGAWGSGKTFLMTRIMERLEDSQPRVGGRSGRAAADRRGDVAVVRFNAWEYQASEKLWAGMVQRIFAEVEKHLGLYGRIWVNFRRNLAREAVAMRRQLLPYTLIVGAVLTALTVGLLALGLDTLALIVPVLGIPGLVRLAVELVGIARQPQSEWIVRFFAQPDYSKHLGFMADIRRDLKALADSLPAGLKIAVFVDDLDRCAPGKAVEVLEAIKLLLDFERFIVCLGIDARIITHAIEEHYGKTFEAAGVTGYEYLQKIVQIPFNIPEPSFDDVRRYLNNLLDAPSDEADTLTFETPVFVADAAVAGPGAPGASAEAELRPADGDVDRPQPPDSFEVKVRREVPFIKAERDAFRTFIPYMVPNPRRIKRLVNVYRLVRDLAPDKGLAGLLQQYDRLFPWLLMNEQAPFTTHVMLQAFEEDTTGKYTDLSVLYADVQPALAALGETRLHHLDVDAQSLAHLVRDFGARITRQDIHILSTLTFNFNPALRTEVRAALANYRAKQTPPNDNPAPRRRTSR